MLRIATLLLGLALVVQADSLAAEERLRDFHVLGIGINKFQLEELNLRRPVPDVAEMAEYFSRQDFDSGKPRREPRLLFDEKATKEGIERELADLPNWVADGGTLALIISTHGVRLGGNWYFSPHDSAQSPDREVSGQTLMKHIDALIARRHCRVLLILHACMAGQILPAAQLVLDKYREPGQGGLILVASCIPNQLGWEVAAGGIFNTTLLLGTKMMQAHVLPTSSVSIKELRRFLRVELQEQLRFAAWKAPGMDYLEQYGLIECSLSIPEDLGLTWADPKLVVPVKTKEATDENAPPQGQKVIDTDASLVGTWVCERPFVRKYKDNNLNEPEEYYRDENGELVLTRIEITFNSNGSYQVKCVEFDETKTGKGFYSFVPGKKFSLIYDTGIDYFSLEKLTADGMVWRNPNRPLDASVLADIRQPVAAMNPLYNFKRQK